MQPLARGRSFEHAETVELARWSGDFARLRQGTTAGGSKARRFARHAARCSRQGFTLVELMVVVTVIGVLVAMAAPSFRRSVEQSHADIAVANLRAIWTAERLYWLENRTFTGDLADLEVSDFIDVSVTNATTPYSFQLDPNADEDSFTATATRSGSSVWSGSFTITEEGHVEGSVSDSNGHAIEASFQD